MADMFDLAGSLVNAGVNWFSGAANRDSQKEINLQNQAFTKEVNQTNWEHSLQMALEGKQYAAIDAMKAQQNSGINAAYLLGAPAMSFSPATVGAPMVSPSSAGAADMRSMGQNISRAISAMKPAEEKVAAVQTAQQIESNNLDLETKKVNLDLLKARIANLTQGAPAPGVNFAVPENNKIEQRPPLMLFGRRWDTNPNTSPMKAWEDQYGDEGPASWILPPLLAANDSIYQARNWMTGKNPSTAADARQAWSDGLSSGAAQLARWYMDARSRLFFGGR